MCINSDCLVRVSPIAWFWGALTHTTLSWTALTYLFVWLFYMLISIPEMIFWVMHMIGEPAIGTYLLNIWVQFPGLYGGWILYFFGFLFPLIQLTALSGINQAGYSNAALQLVVFTMTWLMTGIVHVIGFPYIQRMYERTLVKEVAAEPVVEAIAEAVEEVVEEEEEEEEIEEEEEEEDTDSAF